MLVRHRDGGQGARAATGSQKVKKMLRIPPLGRGLGPLSLMWLPGLRCCVPTRTPHLQEAEELTETPQLWSQHSGSGFLDHNSKPCLSATGLPPGPGNAGPCKPCSQEAMSSCRQELWLNFPWLPRACRAPGTLRMQAATLLYMDPV